MLSRKYAKYLFQAESALLAIHPPTAHEQEIEQLQEAEDMEKGRAIINKWLITTNHNNMNNSIALHITDPARSRQHSSPAGRFIASLLNDARNEPFVRFLFLVLVTTLPMAILLFIPGMFNWWLAVAYLSYNSLFISGPFILLQHNAAHKMLFRKEYPYLNQLVPWLLGPLFGLTPETYTAHHIGMHHPENNLDGDLSSTMKCRRDSFRDFALYYLRFFFLTIPLLSLYLASRKRNRLRRRMLSGEGVYLVVVVILLFFNPQATLVVFLFPLVITRTLMIMGNWAQHAFIDAGDPGNCYRNSISCINTSYNRKCWNDGYHIGHHVYPWLHWTEMPAEFLAHLDTYKQEGAIVFRNTDYFSIWYLLMTKNYRRLALHYVELDPKQSLSLLEIETLLKKRTARIGS